MSDEYLTLVCRAMQVVLISIASLLPALLYYQFDRDERLARCAEKLRAPDLPARLLDDDDGCYRRDGRLIDESLPAGRSGRYRKLPPRPPRADATVLGHARLAARPATPTSTSSPTSRIAGLFDRRAAPGVARPSVRTSSPCCASGATSVTIGRSIQRHQRADHHGGDPRLGARAHIRRRLELALRVRVRRRDRSAGGAEQGPRADRARGALAEAAGRRGALGGELSAEAAPEADSAVAGAGSSDPLPLTALEGIDLYDRTRLASEGVTNIEALAHHNMIDLVL